VIEAISLTKRFGPVQAVQDASFRVEKGEVAAFLGPNGAGKTTCMRILTGFLPATGGIAVVAGHEVSQNTRVVRSVLGYLPESVPLYNDMRVREYLDFRARLKKVARSRRRSRIEEVLEKCGLTHMKNRLMGNLSKGYRQRTGLADALVGNPEVLILDEPTVGLDPNQTLEVRQLVTDLGKERTVLLSTHILSEAEAVSQKIIIINQGTILVVDTPAGLRRRVRSHLPIQTEIKGGKKSDIVAGLEDLKGVTAVQQGEPAGDDREWNLFSLSYRPEADPRESVFQLAKTRGWSVREIHREELSLEQIFRTLTRGEGEGGAGA